MSALVLQRCSCDAVDVDVDAVNGLDATMLAQTATQGQSTRTVLTDADADARRQARGELSGADHIGIRTARMDTKVVLVRLDADLRHQDGATICSKLTPPG